LKDLRLCINADGDKKYGYKFNKITSQQNSLQKGLPVKQRLKIMLDLYPSQVDN